MKIREPLVKLAELLVQVSGAGQGILCLSKERHRTAAFIASVEAPKGSLDSGHELFTVAQEGAPLEKSLLLTGLQLCPLQFVDLKLKTIYPSCFFRFIHLERSDLLPGCLHSGKTGAVGTEISLHSAVAVQIGTMLFLVQQLLAVVLSMNIEKLSANLPQLSHCHRLSIDPTGIFTVSIYFALQ